jgi:hypothetical protein
LAEPMTKGVLLEMHVSSLQLSPLAAEAKGSRMDDGFHGEWLAVVEASFSSEIRKEYAEISDVPNDDDLISGAEGDDVLPCTVDDLTVDVPAATEIPDAVADPKAAREKARQPRTTTGQGITQSGTATNANPTVPYRRYEMDEFSITPRVRDHGTRPK